MAAIAPIPLLPPPPSPSTTRPPSALLLRLPPGISPPLSLSTPNLSIATNCKFLSHSKSHRRSPQIWRTLAAAQDAATLPPPADIVAPLDAAQEIVSDDGVSTIISTLLLIAFVALSVLTVGVIYIAVTDFLQKREKDKFDKEEAAKKKRGGKGKKVKARARAGPRGFGQKIDTEDEFADDD
ncbi:unnamed protein product [Linum tenue]|uniref:Uncharacterized protein n=2 Tax=Linum TaxID=4005 RepID=A0AAV0Q3P4_9ROSI|nr:unnamed protein product [Linum tenue]